jgi:hypothetical protein
VQFSCHYTSYLNFWHQLISVTSPVTYSHRSPLGFYFISRLEDDEATLLELAIDGSAFVRIFPSHLGILFSTSSVIPYPVPVHSSFEDISILSPCQEEGRSGLGAHCTVVQRQQYCEFLFFFKLFSLTFPVTMIANLMLMMQK